MKGQESMESVKGAPLSIYIHVPFCAKKCAYCDFLSHVPEPEEVSAYFDWVLEEIRSWSGLLAGRRIRSIFFGGGTPSFVPAEYIEACMEELRSQCGNKGKTIAEIGSDNVAVPSIIDGMALELAGKHESTSAPLSNDGSAVKIALRSGSTAEKTARSGGTAEKEAKSGDTAEKGARSGSELEPAAKYVSCGMDKPDISTCGNMLGAVAEVTLEANPGTFDEEKLRLWRRAGINRLSIGLQSADDEELARLGRIHDWNVFEKNYLLARKCGFDNINIDLMSALPGQTTESWRRTLEKVLALRPEHISAYSLIIEEGTPFYELYGDSEMAAEASVSDDSVGGTFASDMIAVGPFSSAGAAVFGAVCASNVLPAPLPSEEDERRMYHFTKKLLDEHGYKRYEISNYSLPGYECRHNMAYWTGGDYLGIGLGAASYIEGRRFRAPDDMDSYRRYAFSKKELSCHEKQTKNEAMEEYMFLGLRMTGGVSIEDFNSRFASSKAVLDGGFNSRFASSKAVLDGSFNSPVASMEIVSREADERNIFSIEGVSGGKFNRHVVSAEREGVGLNSEPSSRAEDLFSKYYDDVVERYVKMGLLENSGGMVRLTDKGIDVSNVVLADFLIEEE